MDITTVANLLVIFTFGLVFVIFIMLIRGTARVRREGPPEEQGTGSNPPRPPSEELQARIDFIEKRLSTLISIFDEKGTLTDQDKDRLK